jgi:hypothetical protein
MSLENWDWLCSLEEYIPLEVLGQEIVPLGNDAYNDAYKLSETQYCLARVPFDATDNIVRVACMYWACSEKAFRRVRFREIEGDDLTVCDPPLELLPPKSLPTYRQILDGLKKAFGSLNVMESAGYRWTDGIFIERSIGCRLATYHFRSRLDDDDEQPFAIYWKMKGSLI